MKNLLKIGALSLALVAVVFILNTKAQSTPDTGLLQLQIDAGTGSCQYGTSLDLGIKPASYDAITFDGDFPDAFRCEDNQGIQTGWQLTMASSTLVNASNPAYTIPDSSVTMMNSSGHVTAGVCNIIDGTTSLASLDTVRSILGKTNDPGAICKIQTDVVSLQVITALNQAVGIYTGTLTIDVPNFN